MLSSGSNPLVWESFAQPAPAPLPSEEATTIAAFAGLAAASNLGVPSAAMVRAPVPPNIEEAVISPPPLAIAPLPRFVAFSQIRPGMVGWYDGARSGHGDWRAWSAWRNHPLVRIAMTEHPQLVEPGQGFRDQGSGFSEELTLNFEPQAPNPALHDWWFVLDRGRRLMHIVEGPESLARLRGQWMHPHPATESPLRRMLARAWHEAKWALAAAMARRPLPAADGQLLELRQWMDAQPHSRDAAAICRAQKFRWQ